MDTIETFSNTPVNRLFGFELVSHGTKEAVIGLKVKAEFLQEYGVVHGAIVTAAADTAAVYLVHPSLGAGEKMTSIEFKVNFLGPAVLSDAALEAKAKIVKRGKRIAVADVEVFQAEKLILKGLFTYLIYRD